MNFAGRARQERLRQGMKITELAKAAGIHKNTIINIERNKTDTSVRTAVKICKALGCKPSDLIDA
jgi:DNA-binding XRE family transcriptional regulator